jgi:uncharacterized protein DUF4157
MGSMRIGAAGDRFEREAERAATRAVHGAGAGPARTRPVGGRLDDRTRHRFEGALGADLGGVRVHTGAEVDQVNDMLASHAFTIGSDVYVRRADYRPGTRGGDALLAHELAHTVQARPAGHVALKRRKMHLDFVRMKRMDVQYTRAIRKKLGLQVAPDPHGHGTYGHWWTEIGDLDQTAAFDQWNPAESYGWWPKAGAPGTIAGTWGGVPGELNQGHARDPHQGEDAPVEFHPVMEVDDGAKYETVRADVEKEIRAFAKGFRGVWNWRLGWGRNCQTFQKALKKRVGLHYTKTKDWLIDPRPAEAAKQREADVAKAEAETTHSYTIGEYQLGVYDWDGRGKPVSVGAIRTGERIGVTGRTGAYTWPSGAKDALGEVIWKGDRYWVSTVDFEMTLEQPYPAGQATPSGRRASRLQRRADSVSDSE